MAFTNKTSSDPTNCCYGVASPPATLTIPAIGMLPLMDPVNSMHQSPIADNPMSGTSAPVNKSMLTVKDTLWGKIVSGSGGSYTFTKVVFTSGTWVDDPDDAATYNATDVWNPADVEWGNTKADKIVKIYKVEDTTTALSYYFFIGAPSMDDVGTGDGVMTVQDGKLQLVTSTDNATVLQFVTGTGYTFDSLRVEA